jgi:prolyl oligopeptidase
MQRFVLIVLTLVLPLSLAAPRARAAQGPPVAPVRDVVEDHWGVKLTDPYRYMENIKAPEVQSWVKGQAVYTDSVLSHIPIRDELLARLKELDAGRPYRVFDVTRMPSGRMFYEKIRAEEVLSKLFVRKSASGPERLLIDPSTMTPPGGGHYSISWYVASPDGRRIAYGLAPSGSEQDVLHVLDVETGRTLPDEIDRLEAGYTEPQWLPDGSGFYYGRRRQLAADAPSTEGYKLTRSYLHRLGTPADRDEPVFAKDLWPNVTMTDEDFPSIVLVAGSPYAIGKIKHGDSNPLTLYAAPLGKSADLSKRAITSSPWKLICDVPDTVVDFAVHGGEIYLATSREASRYKIVRTSLSAPDFATAAVVVPQSEFVVEQLHPAKDALYVQFTRGGAGRIGRLGYAADAKLEMLPLPEGFLSARVSASDPDVDGVLVQTSAWTRAGLTSSYDPRSGSLTDTGLSPKGAYDNLPGYESIEVEAPSHDGVNVPLSIIYKAGIKLDGSNPTLLSGYGSYGLNSPVGFNPTRIAWLERGGVLAVAHVRGGGELGEEWHLAGQKLNKPNTWKDFIACAKYLIAKGYTSPEKLAGQGGSAGGITIGRAITERPDLFSGALIDVGAVDATRMEFTMNGVPNIQEFGTVTKQDEFRGLLEMSAYMHVKDGVNYPAVMLSHGMNDPRVEPWESAKMTARLQAATASGKPVLFRVDYGSGHGIGSTKLQLLKSTADKYAFLLWQMGLVKPVP